MALWSTEQIDKLPDSSFAYVNGSVRKLPYKDANGKVDLPHVRDALSRLDQTDGIPESEKNTIRVKLQNALKQAHAAELGEDLEKLSADQAATLSSIPIAPNAAGELPTRFPLLTTFDLKNSNRGHFTVTPTHLRQAKEKFDAGIGFPSSDPSTGLAGDFEHNGHKEAAFWYHAVDVVPHPTDSTKATLYADQVEWTDAGQEAVKGGRFKMVSPTGAFGTKNGKLSVYPHHADLNDKLSNVLMGAGLTNEPFQNMMAPIRLSVHGDEVVAEVNDNQKESDSMEMDLDKLRVMDREKLQVPQLDKLEASKDKLSADELKKFKLETQAADTLSAEDKTMLEAIKAGSKKVVDADAAPDTLSATDKDLLTAIQSGDKVVIDKAAAEQLAAIPSLQKTSEEYRRDKTERFVREQLQRGAIKPDKEKETVDMLMNADEATRKTLEDHLAALPTNELLAAEIGHEKDVQVEVQDELKAETLKYQKEAKENDRNLTYGQAQNEVLSKNTDLKDRVEAARNGKK